MAINNNLRQLRLDSGMTQEQVAEKLNVTRQAVSSYESGRTRPDIDTLIRFAEIYGTDLEGIVYGNTRRLKVLRNVKIAAFILLALTVIFTLLCSALRWSSNYFFPLVNDPALQYIDQHLRLSNAADIMDSLALTLSFWGSIIVTFFILIPKCKVSIKQKLIYILLFVFLLYAVSLPFGIADPVFNNINYTLTPTFITVRLALFFILETVIELIISRRSK